MKLLLPALLFPLFALLSSEVQAQVYFGLGPEAVKAKADKSGFQFLGSTGHGTDSLTLIFKKREDPRNTLSCVFGKEEICTRFSYRLPTETAASLRKNLELYFEPRPNGLWASKEKNFMVQVLEEGIATTVIYTPFVEGR